MSLGPNTYAAATIIRHQKLTGHIGLNYRVRSLLFWNVTIRNGNETVHYIKSYQNFVCLRFEAEIYVDDKNIYW